MAEVSGVPGSVGFLNLAAIVLIGGALGGIGQVVARISLREPEKSEPKLKSEFVYDGRPDGGTKTLISLQQFVYTVIGNIFLGIAGALGVVGVLSLVKVFEADLLAATEPARLVYLKVELFGVAVVGGFIARLILPLLGESIRRRIADTEDRISETEKELEKQKKEQEERIAKLTAENSRSTNQVQELRNELETTKELLMVESAFSALASHSPDRRKQSHDEIKALLAKYPQRRKIVILAARFEVERVTGEPEPPRIDVAIKILSDFLNIEGSSDEDYGDVKLNRACYHVELMKIASDSSEKDKRRSLALSDLRESIKLKEGNRTFASEDPDLKPLRQDKEFQELVRRTVWTDVVESGVA